MNEARFAHYKIGIKQLDDDHHRLLEQMYEFHHLCKTKNVSQVDIAASMEQLHVGLTAHITMEESVMEERSYRWLPAHKAEHVKLQAKMVELTARMRPNAHALDVISNELEDAFLTHIDYYDRQINQ
jgi:hemerythrin-like metal-binding protein